MPYGPFISKVTLPDGRTFDLKDLEARDLIEQLMSAGIKFTIAWDGESTPDITKIPEGVIVEYQDTPYIGTLVASEATAPFITLVFERTTGESPNIQKIYGEYVTVTEGSAEPYTYWWEKLGNTGAVIDDLGNLAYKDTASGSTTLSTADSASFSNGSASVSGTYTPAGSVSVTLTQTPTTITGSGISRSDYTPAGTVSTPTITVTPSTTTVQVKDTNGSVTAGTAASFTQGNDNYTAPVHSADSFVAPTWSATVADNSETLVFAFSAGSFTQGTFTPGSFTQGSDTFTANSPTSVTLPTFKNQTVATGISSATSTQPTFSGTTETGLKVDEITYDKASVQSSTFSGTQATISSTGTATGDISLTKTNKTINITVS